MNLESRGAPQMTSQQSLSTSSYFHYVHYKKKSLLHFLYPQLIFFSRFVFFLLFFFSSIFITFLCILLSWINNLGKVKKIGNGQEPIQSGPEVVKLFSSSTPLTMKFFLLINVKMPTFVGILTFMSEKIAF